MIPKCIPTPAGASPAARSSALVAQSLLLALAAVAALTPVSANAQQFPGLGVNGMVNNELAFQQRFYPWAARQSWNVARQIPNGVPLPFNAMTVHQSLNEGNAAAMNYVRQLQHNSARTSAALRRYNTHAVRGNAYYANHYGGPVYELPYTHNVWNINGYGYARPGYHRYSGTNVYRQGW